MRQRIALGFLLGSHIAYKDDFWATDLRRFGARLGKFVYVMDAVMDLRQDQETGSYNPFSSSDRSIEDFREDLELLAAATADAFERLPLERDVHVRAACCIPEYGNATMQKRAR